MATSGTTLRDAAYVLHTYPYSETSLIVELFTRAHGRIAVVAKGARSATSKLRGLMSAFQRLDVAVSGRSELKTLKSAEHTQIGAQLAGEALLAAFYLNELVLRLTHKEDAYPALFDAYQEAITALRAPSLPATQIAITLRRFERLLIAELGYAIDFASTADTGQAIDANGTYWIVADRGVLVQEPQGFCPKVSGRVLHDLAAARFDASDSASAARDVMRYLIQFRLEGVTLHTRSLLRELRQTP
jgi:DNA repair protein RecO (recombination protein O)